MLSMQSASTDMGFFSSKSSKSSASPPTTTTTVTTRTYVRPVPKKPAQPATSPTSIPSRSSSVSSSPLSSPLSSPVTTPPPSKKKRKSTDTGPGPSSAPLVARPIKKLRAEKPRKRVSTKSSRTSSRQNTLAPSPEPIYRSRSSRSRSTSLFPHSSVPPMPPRRWATNEDGDPGPSHCSSESVVKRLMKSYKAYFINREDPDDKSFEPHETDYPVTELEYPNTGAVERFILLTPKDKDHYSPILDLEKSLYTIVEYYLTPEQQALIGSIPSELLSEAVTPPPSPSPSPPNSRASSSSRCSSSSLSSLTSIESESEEHQHPRINLLRAVQRAINTRDGPLLLKSMDAINEILRSLKYPKLPSDPFAPTPRNSLKYLVESWTGQSSLPPKVLMRIIEENYQRCVGPNVAKLKKYEAFSSKVYGELMPSLTHEIINLTQLNEDSLFLDLGSGVGNVVVQAALQTGCTSYGIELVEGPAQVAQEMVEQFKIRCRMWGVNCGKMELEQGDMLKSQRVTQLIPKADVVLVDNKVFEESLNEALRPKFLDLKEGAIVISLKPFVSSMNGLNARVTERNVDDMSAIFDVTERPYYPGSVSWGNGGGTYYVHRVDRRGYAEIRHKFESTRGRRSTSSKYTPARRCDETDWFGGDA